MFAGATSKVVLLLLGLSMIVAQTPVPGLDGQCIVCIGSNTNRYYCKSNNQCFDSVQFNGKTVPDSCSQNVTVCIQSAPNDKNYTIDKVATTIVKTTSLAPGQSELFYVTSDFSKNTFINITYDDANKPADGELKFYAFSSAKQTPIGKLYDMTYLYSVLLPHNTDPYGIFVANNGTRTLRFNVVASNAYSLLMGASAAVLAFAQLFLY